MRLSELFIDNEFLTKEKTYFGIDAPGIISPNVQLLQETESEY